MTTCVAKASVYQVKEDASLNGMTEQALSDKELDQLVSKALLQARSNARGEQQPASAAAKIIPADIARLIDHTLLVADATEAQIEQLCREAKQHRFASVCVNPTWVPLARTLLVDSLVKVATVVGFPLGASLPEVKAFETERAIQAGAHEIDMVINVGRLKSGNHQVVFQDVTSVVAVARRSGAPALVSALAAIDCEVDEVIVRHCHAIILGRILSVTADKGHSLVYSQGRYSRLSV